MAYYIKKGTGNLGATNNGSNLSSKLRTSVLQITKANFNKLPAHPYDQVRKFANRKNQEGAFIPFNDIDAEQNYSKSYMRSSARAITYKALEDVGIKSAHRHVSVSADGVTIYRVKFK